MIWEEHQLVFIHIPKTGGTTVERMMFPTHSFSNRPDYRVLYGWDDGSGWLNHLTIEEVASAGAYLELSEPVVFTIVRNPWDRVVSEYHWKLASSGLQVPFGEFVRLLYVGDTDAISKYYRAPIAFHQHIRPQVRYVAGLGGHEISILRFENFADEVTKMLRAWGVDCESAPRLRVSAHGHYTNYYNRCTQDMVGKIYREDCETFSYSYGFD